MKRFLIIGAGLNIALLLAGCNPEQTRPASMTTTTVTVSATADVTTAHPATTASTTTVSATVVQTTAKKTTTAKTTVTQTAPTTEATTAGSTTTVATTTVATMVTVTGPTARPEVTVTIPEGYSFMQIARLLEQRGVCTAAEFYEVCQSYTPQSFTIPINGDRCFRMEGYLFPDTYRFYVDDDPQTVLIRMLNNFRDKVGEIDDNTLILASIIEQEARSDKHMRLVSSVFHNRLNNTAEFPYLNADPTRDYVNDFITGNPLLSGQEKYAQLYNTCNKRRGLPAGPICSPGLRAIQAAKEPTPSFYYYFFYGKDFDNHYSETLEEHQQKIAEIGVG